MNKPCFDSFRRTVKGLSLTYTWIHFPKLLFIALTNVLPYLFLAYG